MRYKKEEKKEKKMDQCNYERKGKQRKVNYTEKIKMKVR